MSSDSSLNADLSEKTPVLGLRLWVVIGICVGVLIVFILAILSIWITSKRKTRKTYESMPVSQIPSVSKEIPVDIVGNQCSDQILQENEGPLVASHDKFSDRESVKTVAAQLTNSNSCDAESIGPCSSARHNDRAGSSCSGEEGSSGSTRKAYSAFPLVSPLVGLPESSHLGWGHWFTLRDLELATNRFSNDNVLGEGGYGVVYRGRLINGTEVAVKKLLNNLGQAEKEFRVEVEAIGHVRHKNLVRLLGYCIEGIHRMLVYEYVNNGNLEQWLHGAMHQRGILSWEKRMKVILGTAKALAYLHEAIEPKVVHRDIKSSNILIDEDYNGKISDFGLAKLLGSDKSFVATRVMGTFGYVAPEYANTGLLNERSDVYSFGVLLLETVTGRDPVDYGRPSNEVNLVEWLKMMVGSRRADEVVDQKLEVKPSVRALKRTLLVALKCIDSDSDKRPKMGQVVRMLEADEFAQHDQDRRSRRSRSGSTDMEVMKESNSSSDVESRMGLQEYRTSKRFQV
ncbi:probable receptor-like protein kinase At2g42960 [Zingiber officinale]|uniref:probable receptor-like protein kinase At2g42960 n=1 Tax=Zingiber officinale TaxID=94328 RepID=UPI001C4CF106|nr:probable receptor-like protein kinase At2g42960 [Zingiber officinale]XP_042453580.1 probable receptor-like protein kinase At2g42960 [Zingiber officinale]